MCRRTRVDSATLTNCSVSNSVLSGGGAVTELVTGKGGHSEICFVDLAVVLFSIGIDEVFAVVLRAAADAPENTETRRCGGVGVNVDNLATLNVLEKSHCCVPGVVLDHVSVLLALADVKRRVLENATLAISALRWVLKEVLAYRCQVLSAESLLFLKLFLAVGESTALLFLAILTILTVEPESAQLCLYLLFPPVFCLNCIRNLAYLSRTDVRLLALEVVNGRVETTNFRRHISLDRLEIRIVAVLRADCCTVGHRTGRIAVCLLANFTKRQDAHLLRMHFPGVSEGLMLEALAWMRKAGLLEILLRCSSSDGLLEIHLELRHELLVLGRCWCGISATVVGEVTLHVGRLLLHVVQVRGVIHLVRLVISWREGS